MADASKTLKGILSIIAQDVSKIRRGNKGKQLSSEDALTLSRYANTIGGLIDDEWAVKEKLKKRYGKLKTEELIKMYQDGNKKAEEK